MNFLDIKPFIPSYIEKFKGEQLTKEIGTALHGFQSELQIGGTPKRLN